MKFKIEIFSSNIHYFVAADTVLYFITGSVSVKESSRIGRTILISQTDITCNLQNKGSGWKPRKWRREIDTNLISLLTGFSLVKLIIVKTLPPAYTSLGSVRARAHTHTHTHTYYTLWSGVWFWLAARSFQQILAYFRNEGIKNYEAVPQLRRLVAGLSTRRPGFAPKLVHVGFVMGKVELGQYVLRVVRFSCQYQFSGRSSEKSSHHIDINNNKTKKYKKAKWHHRRDQSIKHLMCL
jgi:hypothetical protein